MTSFFGVIIRTSWTQAGIILKCFFDRKREAVIIRPHLTAYHLGVCAFYINKRKAVKTYSITVAVLACGGRALVKMLRIDAVDMIAPVPYGVRGIAIYLDIDISY